MATRIFHIKLKRRLDPASRDDAMFVRRAAELSSDGTFHYAFTRTAYSDEDSWSDRMIYQTVGLSSHEDIEDELREFKQVAAVGSYLSEGEEDLGITGNTMSFRCQNTTNIIANQYYDVAEIFPLEDGYGRAVNYNQGSWDSSAQVCFNYLVAATGSSSLNGIKTLTDSTVEVVCAYYYDSAVPNLDDSTHYVDKIVMFPCRDSGGHSLERFRVASAEAHYSSGRLNLALELAENDVPRTPITSANALYNRGIRIQSGSDNTNSFMVSGICHLLHWSADSSDALCTAGDYEEGERYISASPHRTNILGWNTDLYQEPLLGGGDSTKWTGFFFDGLTLYPIVRDRMTFGTGEGSNALMFHSAFDGDNDSTAAIVRYNYNAHPTYYNNMHRVKFGEDVLVHENYAIAGGPEEDWVGGGANAHQGQVCGIVGARWNDKGTVGVAPGSKIDMEVYRNDLFLAADYGAADVVSYSLVYAYEYDFGPLHYHDVVGDYGDVPIGSYNNSQVFKYLNEANVWMLVPPFGNYDEYYCFDTEIPTVGGLSAWDGTSTFYNYGEAVDFVSPVPAIAPSIYFSPDSPDEPNKSTYRDFAGQSCTTPAGAGHFLLLKERRPELDLMEAKQIFAYSSRKYDLMEGATSYWHPKYGFGRPDMVVAAATDLTAAGCPAPKGLIVDGENTAYAALRWTNPQYRNFEETKILRKETEVGSSYKTFINVHSETINEYPVGVEQGEKLEWNDLITTSPNGLSVTDSTYYGKVQLYFDFWAKSSYISQFAHTGLDDWGETYYDLISGPGDTTSAEHPTGMPEVYVDYGGTHGAALYNIDSSGVWFGYFVDHIRNAAIHFYNLGTPLYGIFLDDFGQLPSWSYISGPGEGSETYDRYGNQNDSSHIFQCWPEVWDYYEASDYYPIWGDDQWEEMTITEQREVISSWWAAIPYQQFEDLEVEIWDIINNYCAPDGKLVVNGNARRLDNIGVGEDNWVPRYGTTRLFEGAGETSSRDLDEMDGGDGTGSNYSKYDYCHPNDQILVYCLGSTREWGDWYDGDEGYGERNLQMAANLAMKRGAYLGVDYGETPFDGGTRLSAIFNPNDVDDRWPNYVSGEDYMTNHTDGTVVYEGIKDYHVDSPGKAGNYTYTAFAKNTWGDWSEPGIGFAQALKRKSKTTMTVTSVLSETNNLYLYGTISPGGDSFTENSETHYNDSTVVVPIGYNTLPHGQGWYAVGATAREVYPITRVQYDSDGKLQRIRVNPDDVDVSTVYVGQELDIQYLSLHVGNHRDGNHPSRVVEEDTFPRSSVALTASGEQFSEFNPYLDATAVFDRVDESVKIILRNVRNPQGIKDIHLFRYNGIATQDSDFPLFPSEIYSQDSTSLSVFIDKATYGSFTSYKIVPVSGSNTQSTEPIYLMGVPTSPLAPPPFSQNGFFFNFAPILKVENIYPLDVTFTIQKNGVDYLTGDLGASASIDVYDLFWVEGDTYTAITATENYSSNLSGEVTPSLSDIPDARKNFDIADQRYIIPIGDSTFAFYEDSYFNTVYQSATNRLGTFRVGQFVWPGEGMIQRYIYRTPVVPEQYGGPGAGGIPPQFEFWNSQDGGDLLLQFEANPIEFEFDFGIRNRRVKVLDGPDKVQMMYQDHVLRSMLWRSVPVHKYRRFLSKLKRFVGEDVWLDSKDFTMPIRGRWPFQYMAGYRYKINVVDLVVKPVDGRGTQRVDVELKYKLLTTDDGAV